MSASEVREALETLVEGLSAWLEGDQRREAVQKEIAIWCGTESDRLTELRQEQQRHWELQHRLLAAERIVSEFAAGHGIDTEPLTRLLLGGKPEEGDGSKVTVLLWQLDALARLERQGEGGAPLAEEPLSPARHSPDFRSVAWYRDNYTFTPTQAACVKVLWQAWENGTPEVGQQHILETAGSDSQHLKDVFKDCQAWGTMIIPGTTQGSFRLAEPT